MNFPCCHHCKHKDCGGHPVSCIRCKMETANKIPFTGRKAYRGGTKKKEEK